MAYNGKQQQYSSKQLEKQADALLAQATSAEDRAIIEQAQAILEEMNINPGVPLVLEDAKTVVDSFGALERLATIFYERDEAKAAAEAVINANNLYSETFTPERFLKLAVGYAVAQTYGISFDVTSTDELLAIRDLHEGIFGRALSNKIRSKKIQEIEELVEQGKLPLFEYMHSGEGADETVQ